MSGDPQTLRLLVELEDERVRSRWRESVLLSVIAHMAILIAILVEPKVFKSVKESLGLVEETKPRRQLTYLAAPPDNQVVKSRPRTPVLSDKDRLARPGLDAPPKLKMPAPPPPTPAPPAEKPRAAEPEKQQLAQALPPPPLAPRNESRPETGPALQLGDVTREQPKLPVPQTSTPGRALEDAIRGMARNRGGGQSVGELPEGGAQGINPRSPAAVGEARILTDTQGVDFDPYLRRVVADIRRNWYAVMPEIARMGKRGRVVVIFEIVRDGSVPKLYLMASSTSEPLDRAALAGISASVPFPPLPAEFRGPMVRLQVTFLYNMWLEQ